MPNLPALSLRPFIFVRHGQTDWNATGRFQGQTDIPLNTTGRAQARYTGTFLSRFKPSLIVSSQLSRARETANIIAHACGNPPHHIDPRLQERNFGQLEGCTQNAILSRFNFHHMDEFGKYFEDIVPQAEIEPTQNLLHRVIDSINHWSAEDAKGKPVDSRQPLVFVTHGGITRALRNHLTGTMLRTGNCEPVLFHHLKEQWYAIPLTEKTTKQAFLANHPELA